MPNVFLEINQFLSIDQMLEISLILEDRVNWGFGPNISSMLPSGPDFGTWAPAELRIFRAGDLEGSVARLASGVWSVKIKRLFVQGEEWEDRNNLEKGIS